MKYSTLKSLFLATSLMVITPITFAHGSLEPIHGGVVQAKHDLIFELVREDETVSLYLRDHGEPVNAESVNASITVLSSGEKQDVVMNFVSGNQLAADIAIQEGAKVLVKAEMEGHHAITVRYVF